MKPRTIECSQTTSGHDPPSAREMHPLYSLLIAVVLTTTPLELVLIGSVSNLDICIS